MMQFTQDMKIGVPHIDRQHKELVDTVNKISSLGVINPSKEEIKKHLDFLGEYVVRHFSDEEQLQIESKYPRYRQHKEIHEEFVRTFKSLYAEFEKSGPSAKLVIDMTNTVSSWIIMHIKREDITFGKHYTMDKQDRLKTRFRSKWE